MYIEILFQLHLFHLYRSTYIYCDNIASHRTSSHYNNEYSVR